MAPTLDSLRTFEGLLDHCGVRELIRGLPYPDADLVSELEVSADQVQARVQGEDAYLVRIWIESNTVHHACSCPRAEPGTLCEHGVGAVLAWLHQTDQRIGVWETTRTGSDGDLLRHFAAPDKDALDELLHKPDRGPASLDRAVATRSPTSASTLPAFAALVTRIDGATSVARPIQSFETPSFMGRINQTLDVIDDLVCEGLGDRAVLLAEHAVTRIEHVLGVIIDYGRCSDDVFERVHKQHLAACRAARPDPIRLARRLCAYELRSGWSAFESAAFKYRRILGTGGLTEYRRLLEPLWSAIPALRPHNAESELTPECAKILSAMQAVADADGSLTTWIRVTARDLSTPSRYADIAQRCRKAGNLKLAEDWARRGLQVFPLEASSLRNLAAQLASDRQRPADALDLLWEAFHLRPATDTYERLKEGASFLAAWPTWRAKAHNEIRRQLDFEKRTTAGQRATGLADEWVRILIKERDLELAWKEACTWPCETALLLWLAQGRERERPADAIPVYRRHVSALIAKPPYVDYESAVAYLRKLRTLARRTDTGDEFERYLAEVRASNRRKRNFLELIDAESWT